MFFLLSANDDLPPGPPDSEDLAKWDDVGKWGAKGAALNDAPNEDGISIGKLTLWGDGHTGKDASMILKPGFVIHDINFTKDQAQEKVEEILKEIGK